VRTFAASSERQTPCGVCERNQSLRQEINSHDDLSIAMTSINGVIVATARIGKLRESAGDEGSYREMRHENPVP
jgi:hypothetical protein